MKLFKEKKPHFGPLPVDLARHLPNTEPRDPWEPTDAGGAVVATRHALVILGPLGVIDSGLWHEVQYAKWDATTKTLTVVWSHPDREVVRVQTLTEDPKRLMDAVITRVEKTILATRSFYTADGVRVSATVRRRVDGELFSVLVADGVLSDADRQKAEGIEQGLRDELGLED